MGNQVSKVFKGPRVMPVGTAARGFKDLKGARGPQAKGDPSDQQGQMDSR